MAACVGCGKRGDISAHRPGCYIPLMWEAHNDGNHNRCKDGGLYCERPLKTSVTDELLALVRAYGMVCTEAVEGYAGDKAEVVYDQIEKRLREVLGGR